MQVEWLTFRCQVVSPAYQNPVPNGRRTYNLALGLRKKRYAHEALAAYEQERVFAGDTPTTHAKRAHVLAAIGRHDEARVILQEILARRQQQWVTA